MSPPEPDPEAAASTHEPPPRNATILEVARAVFASFLGIRKGQSMRRDAVTIRPHQVIVVALVLVALFVVSLLVIVRIIIRMAAA